VKKKFALTLILAAAGSAFLFGAGTPSILAPHPAAPLAKAKAKPLPAAAAPLQLRGKILMVHPADKDKGTAEWIVLRSGKRRVSINVGASASFVDAHGAKVKPRILKAGEIVRVSYRHKGKSNTALTIRV
jgi:hypothetical protein